MKYKVTGLTTTIQGRMLAQVVPACDLYLFASSPHSCIINCENCLLLKIELINEATDENTLDMTEN